MTRAEFERNDSDCRAVNAITAELERKHQLRRDLLERRDQRAARRHQRAAYVGIGLVALAPVIVASIR